MVRKIMLMKLTDNGVKDIMNAPRQIEEAISTFGNMGGKMLCFYTVMGEYDYVAIAEAPDEEIAMAFIMGLNAGGNIRTTTSNAFTTKEFAAMVEKCHLCFQDVLDMRPGAV
ncbi:MAG: GYD domain-containing protein [Dehalococcoidales bacterium]